MSLDITLPHAGPLVAATLVARPNRFVARMRLASGAIVEAHCVNPGRMEGLVRPGARTYLVEAPAAKTRRLRYVWELIECAGVLVGAHTSRPNALVRKLLEGGHLEPFSCALGQAQGAAVRDPDTRMHTGTPEDRLRAEVSVHGGRRIDFCVAGPTPHFIEVKNCHLVYPDGCGYFPDSVSARATHHLHTLSDIVMGNLGPTDALQGRARASVLFTVQHPGATALRPSDLHDPAFAAAARKAANLGVAFHACKVAPTLAGYRFEGMLPVDLRPYATAQLEAYRQANAPYSGITTS